MRVVVPLHALCYPMVNKQQVFVLFVLKKSRGTITTDIQERSQTMRHFYHDMRLKMGVFRFCRMIKITTVLVQYVTASKGEMAHGMGRLWMHWFCICFCLHGQQKPKHPQFDPYGRHRHYSGQYTRSEISVGIPVVTTHPPYMNTRWLKP